MVWQGIKLWLRAEWQTLFLHQHPAPAAKPIPAPVT
jgi:hypothetical protein